MSDLEDRSSCYSYVNSSLSIRESQSASKKIKISHTSIKGICKSIRNLTNDLIQSESSTVLNDTDYISVGKESPVLSGEKKYRPSGKAS